MQKTKKKNKQEVIDDVISMYPNWDQFNHDIDTIIEYHELIQDEAGVALNKAKKAEYIAQRAKLENMKNELTSSSDGSNKGVEDIVEVGLAIIEAIDTAQEYVDAETERIEQELAEQREWFEEHQGKE